ncbi:MAG TPA: FtsQ-type POTRA domain-containing protein [Candidatus Omnitrophica bacterium]|nr:FtsQ-type POTRA domain-containing protein [Candidatus Omnitrophota bacterium]
MFKRVIVIVVGVLLGGGIAYIFVGSPLFLVKEIEIQDGQLVDKRDLSQWGLEEDRNIFLIGLKGVREKIEAIPEIKRAVIKKKLPYKIVVYIDTYKPSAFLGKDKLLAVSKEGVVFPFDGRATDTSSYPVIMYEYRDLPIGESLPPLKRGIEAYLAVKNIPLDVDVIAVKNSDNIVLYMMDTGTEIRMGKDGFAKKAEYLKILLRELKSKSVKYIDLRFGRDIVVKP